MLGAPLVTGGVCACMRSICSRATHARPAPRNWIPRPLRALRHLRWHPGECFACPGTRCTHPSSHRARPEHPLSFAWHSHGHLEHHIRAVLVIGLVAADPFPPPLAHTSTHPPPSPALTTPGPQPPPPFVQEVQPGSPAEEAGLTPQEDFILAADDMIFESMEDFGDYLEEKEGCQVSFFVYHMGRDTVRFVSLLLSQEEWGPPEKRQTGLGALRTPAHACLRCLPGRGAESPLSSPLPELSLSPPPLASPLPFPSVFPSLLPVQAAPSAWVTCTACQCRTPLASTVRACGVVGCPQAAQLGRGAPTRLGMQWEVARGHASVTARNSHLHALSLSLPARPLQSSPPTPPVAPRCTRVLHPPCPRLPPRPATP